MHDVHLVNTIASHFQNHVIYIVSPSTNLYVRYAFYESCFSTDAGSAIFFISSEIKVKNICAFNCSSLVSEQPGGALMYIEHKATDQSPVHLSMLSYSLTPATTKTYCSIGIKYGDIEYSFLNSTDNSALCNPSIYIWPSSNDMSVTPGRFIQIINGMAIGEVIFHFQQKNSVTYINMINNTCQVDYNAVVRSYASKTTIEHGVFIDVHGNLFIATTNTAEITLYDCYFPVGSISKGNVTVIGDIISSPDIIHIAFDICGLTQKCSRLNNIVPLIPFTKSSIFLLLNKY